MKYCKKCAMPDTRPYIRFDDQGVCYPCLHYENRDNIDWAKRWEALERLADKYRGSNGNYYDCIVTVSAGKNSYFQTHVFKERLGMNPLLITVNNSSWTETGRHNWDNLLKEFGVDAHIISLNPKVCKKMFKIGMEKWGFPVWYFDLAIYAYPIQMAIKFGIPLIVYGENTNYEYGGPFGDKETYSALNQINNDVIRPFSWDKWIKEDSSLSLKDFNPCIYPSAEAIKQAKLDPIHLSYFIRWNGYEQMQFARTRGFRTLDDAGEWKREGFIEQYAQIDTVGYLTDHHFKFLKYGFSRPENVSLMVREGRITREEAVKWLNEEDHKLDRRMLEDFLSFIDYREEDFWKLTDKFANREILEKRNGIWRLKQPCR